MKLDKIAIEHASLWRKRKETNLCAMTVYVKTYDCTVIEHRSVWENWYQ